MTVPSVPPDLAALPSRAAVDAFLTFTDTDRADLPEFTPQEWAIPDDVANHVYAALRVAYAVDLAMWAAQLTARDQRIGWLESEVRRLASLVGGPDVARFDTRIAELEADWARLEEAAKRLLGVLGTENLQFASLELFAAKDALHDVLQPRDAARSAPVSPGDTRPSTTIVELGEESDA